MTTRLTKTPKVYVRDTGLLHSLLEVDTMQDLLGHPIAGGSFESLAVESLINAAPASWHPYFYRTATGNEIDLVFSRANTLEMAIEIKTSTSPVISSGSYRSCDALGIVTRYVVHPGDGREPYESGGVMVTGLTELVKQFRASQQPT